MRISHQMLHNQSTQRLQQNAVRMADTFAQASSGKKILRPSDAPQATVSAMKVKQQLADMEQFKTNHDQSALLLDEADNKLQSMSSILQRVSELGVQANNDTLGDSDRLTIKNEVAELTRELRTIANSQVNGEALFPATGNPKQILAAKGTALEVTFPATLAFGEADELFTTLESMASKLTSNEIVDLDSLKQSTDRLSDALAIVGARKNRLESIQNRMEDTRVEQTKILSQLEDVDFAEVLTKLKSEEAVYQAALSATSKLFTASLVDYLR